MQTPQQQTQVPVKPQARTRLARGGSAGPWSRTRTGRPLTNRRLAGAAVLLLISILGVKAFARPVWDDRSPRTVRATLSTHAARSSDARLTLRVYNYARIDRVSLARSEKVASSVFEKPGIAITWVDCALSHRQFLAYPACQSDRGATDLILRILPRRMALKERASGEPLGFAQQCPDTEPACELTVFSFRVDELATHGYREDLVLGHVIAHEIAHVLLGPGHSEEGIMRAEWSRYDLQRISWGLPLGFTRDQSRQLRNAILRRMNLPDPESSTRADLAR